MNRQKEAVPYFKKALKLDPSFLDARKNLAVALLSLGEFAQSERLRGSAVCVEIDDEHALIRSDLRNSSRDIYRRRCLTCSPFPIHHCVNHKPYVPPLSFCVQLCLLCANPVYILCTKIAQLYTKHDSCQRYERLPNFPSKHFLRKALKIALLQEGRRVN